MKLRFTINYHTAWGQSLHVVLAYQSGHGRERTLNLPMQTDDGVLWTAETAVMESRQQPITAFTYYYQVEDADGHVLRREWSGVPRTYACDSSKHYLFPDSWRDMPLQHHLYTLAYRTTAVGKPLETVRPERLPLFRKTIVFRVSAPQLGPGESLALCGNHPAIGSWSPARYLRMTHVGEYDWMLSVNIDAVALPLEYKYVVVDDKTHALKAWEEGDNRSTAGMSVADGQVLVLYGESLRLREATWRAAGVVVPVFSLRSEHSYGVGDFGDLRRLVDWAVATGMRVIQLLPVNDTTSMHGWTDSHPYNAISVFALHPHYLDLEQLGTPRDAARATAFNRQRRELNALAQSDYIAVDRVKADYVDEVFAQRGETVLRSAEFRQFFADNGHWLVPYAAFCVLRDRYHTARFTDWREHAVYREEEIVEFCKQNAEVQKIYYVQFNLWMQLRAAADYARGKGVSLKGDLAIGVYRDSVETWTNPHLFNMDSQTGTPPDHFMPNGQNWGFPTYRWDDDGESDDGRRLTLTEWFYRRFHWMEQFFDAFRIDHVAAFFCTWEIPLHAVHATLGHYAPSLPMSDAEIGQFGLPFRKELMTRPFVNDGILDKYFGIHAAYVRDNYLQPRGYGLYDVRPDYDTQLKVRDHFHGRVDENSLWIRDGLYRLLENVLFVEDPRQPGMYHPRFGACTLPVYDALGTDDRAAFARLYNNYFYERHDDYWGRVAHGRLSRLLSRTRMLVCAEDLGLLPRCVAPTLDALRILTLEVQDMPKLQGQEFAHIDAYPYRSVATFSTHDMPPMRLWWEENSGRTQRYYTTMLQKQGRAPQSMPPQIAEEIVARHLYGPSMLCMLALQDWLALDGMLRSKNPRDERINHPYDSYNQWSYRMHLTLEELTADNQLNTKLKIMITRSKR